MPERMVSLDDPASRREWLRRLQSSAETRAKRAKKKVKMKFALPPEFAVTLYERQHGRCAVSGVKFHVERFPDALVKHPFAPSIDCILSDGHYTPDNVRLVCVAVNFGMGQWGQEVYMTLARAAVAREAREQRDPDPQGDSDWDARQREKIAAATALRDSLPKAERGPLSRRVSALKAALTKGPGGLREAASKARETARRRR